MGSLVVVDGRERVERCWSSAMVRGSGVGRASVSGSVGTVRLCRRWWGGSVGEFFWRMPSRASSVSKPLRPPRPPAKRVVNTMPLSVSVDAGARARRRCGGTSATTIAAGDGLVGGDRQGVAGVVVEPGEDLDVGAVGEAVVGEVGLPALVGVVGFEADVGRTSASSSGSTGPSLASIRRPVDRRDRHGDLVVVLEVPGDGQRSSVETLCGELANVQVHDQRRDVVAGLGRGPKRPAMISWNAASLSVRYGPATETPWPRTPRSARATSAWGLPSNVTAKITARLVDIETR